MSYPADEAKSIDEKSPKAAVAQPGFSTSSAYFETRKIEKIDDDTWRVNPSLGAYAISLAFALMGLGVFGLWIASTFTAFEGPGSLPLLVIGALFVVAGIAYYHSSNEQIIIHRQRGISFIQAWHPSAPLDTQNVAVHIPVADITAIQYLSREVKRRTNRNRRSSHYTEFLVNACTSDGQSHTVLTTLKESNSKHLAEVLAELFSVPAIGSATTDNMSS